MKPATGPSRWTTADRVTLAEAAGIAGIFVATALGRTLLALPLLAVPLAYVIFTRAHRDAAAGLSIYVALLWFIPSGLIIGPLGNSGTPANALGILFVIWWFYARSLPGLGVAKVRSPVRWSMYAFGAALVASYAVMAFRPIYPEEISGADRGVLFFLGCMGVTLLACDGVSSRARLDTLLRRLTMAAAAVATFGVYQFFTKYSLAGVHVPGLKVNEIPIDDFGRSSFNRVAGTAIHPIEYGIVMGMMLPLALHFALFAKRRRAAWWYASVVIGLGIPMSVSRSAIVTIAVALAFVVPTWPWAWKKRGAWVGALFAVAVRFTIPGLLGTVKSLFVNIANDPSTTGRTQDYGYFAELFRQRPILGRGFYTFLPQIYTVFDNQYLVILVEMGVVGLLVMSGIFICGIGAGRAARAAAQDDETRHLGQVLAGSIAGGAVGFATFDGFSFAQASGLMFLLIGCAGALRRLTRAEVPAMVPVSDEEPELVRVAVGPDPTENAQPSVEPVVDEAPARTAPLEPGRRRYWFNNPS